jgi:hypothetical protein
LLLVLLPLVALVRAETGSMRPLAEEKNSGKVEAARNCNQKVTKFED